MEKEKPFFAVIWDGAPHRPFRALEKDKEGFEIVQKIIVNGGAES